MAAVRAKESALKLEPVYLVEPLPEPEPSSRRTWLSLGLAFAVGGLVGFYPGLRVGQGGTSGEVVDDEELVRLRWLAVEAPLTELEAGGWQYLHLLSSKYRDDDVLWLGFDRLVQSLIQPGVTDERKDMAVFASLVLERAPVSHASGRTQWAALLRGRR